MLIVSTNISDIFTMAESENNIEDLEDGEIESEGEGEGEETNQTVNDTSKQESFPPEQLLPEKIDENVYYSKSGKKKKSKSNKEQKYKDKSRKSRKYGGSPEDDHAGKIEKAIRKAMNKNDYDQGNVDNDIEDRRKHKKRKKYEGDESSSKKRKKQDYSDEVDESEMMCIRGASPIIDNKGMSTENGYPDDERDSYASDSSHSSRDHQSHRAKRHRASQRDRNKNKSDRRRNAHPMQDPDGVCLYYMQGKCHKGDDCIYSHDAQPPRKMELCKFYLMDCCAKRDKCLYMHSDFPCKYYHTGLPCVYKDECKFAHGKPLSEVLKTILLKHIESAPKEILGDFPRLNREGALKMIQTTQANLRLQYPEVKEEKSIPSLFELNIPNPHISPESVQFNNDKQSKVSPKIRQSRWQNENSNQNFNSNLSPNSTSGGAQNVLNIKNLTGVLTPRQILDLSKMGIDNLDQLGQLTVLQLNSIGISLKQITEIQLNTMSIQKLGLINANAEQQSQYMSPISGTKDLDLRVPPMIPCNNVPVSSDSLGKDVDMRFQPSIKLASDVPSYKPPTKEPQENKDMIDIDQYTKDALKFLSKDKENIDISNECFEDEKPTMTIESKDVDHRVLPFSEDSTVNFDIPVENNLNKKEGDIDIRFNLPEPAFKSPEKRYRRSTTDDDEDNNLLIDEKWYSSDEEKNIKRKSPSASPQQTVAVHRTPTRNAVEPSSVLSKLGDLSKIDISEEVTKLLNTMKNNLQEKKVDSISESPDTRPSKDPRVRRSPDKVSDSNKSAHKRSPRVSIYECVDGEPTDGRRRTDVDLRPDYKIPTFGDTDLRQSSSGDIDFRLGLPFKAIPNYTPASEIDGSYNSHPPMTYKLVLIDIPRPDYTDIRNSTAKSQALSDPRLRKVFRLSLDESGSDNEKPTKATAPSGPRIDPRRKPKEITETTTQEQKQNSLDMQSILQNSNWYKELSTNNKIFVNQNLAPVTQMLKQFQQEKSSGKNLDLASIQNNNVLCSIFANLGVSLGENGEFSYLPKPKEALLKTPTIFNQNANPFGINNNMPMPQGMDGSGMNMMNMPPLGMGGSGNMNNMNVHMHGFNQNFPPDPRGGPTPGLLGIAPNIPHNFNNNFGGPNNFGNMPFNGPAPGNDFGFGNRGSHRGRGNDRWNRGVSGRGNRKNFNDRGNWKNDRN